MALRRAQVQLVKTPTRWQRQDWGLANSRENLNRIGGAPTWIQGADYPTCSECNAPMRFVLQLDSELPTVDGGPFSWGSGGIGYVFWCAPCRVSALSYQDT